MGVIGVAKLYAWALANRREVEAVPLAQGDSVRRMEQSDGK